MSVTSYGRFPEDISPPSWLPDWKDPGAYKIRELVKPDEFHRYFAWQFLRRNYEYQQVYYKTLETAEVIDKHLGNTHCRGYVKRRGVENYTEENDDAIFEGKLTALCDKFLLNGYLPDPSYDDFLMPPMIIGHNIKRPPWVKVWHSDILEDLSSLELCHRFMEIDLRYPLNPQIEIAKQNLIEDQDDYCYGGRKPLSASKKYDNKIIMAVLHESDPSIEWMPETGKEFKKLCLVFLYCSFDPQIDFHNATLKKLQREYLGKVLIPTWNKRNPESLTRYLRILDALSSGAEPPEIKSVLFPDKKAGTTYVDNYTGSYKGTYDQQDSTYRKALKDANQYLSVGWRSLCN